MRAFANQLEMLVGQLSEIFSGKKRLTPHMITRVADRLAVHPDQKYRLLSAATAKGQKKESVSAPVLNYDPIPEDVFNVIADWQHFAILNLIKLKTFQPDPRWIASRLGLSTTEVKVALDRLERVGMVLKTASGSWKRVKSHYISSYGVPSLALRTAHKQDISKALEALDNIPMSLCDITSITFPAELSKIAEVKKQISFFQRRMARLMENDNATSVYNLNVQLIPITKERS